MSAKGRGDRTRTCAMPFLATARYLGVLRSLTRRFTNLGGLRGLTGWDLCRLYLTLLGARKGHGTGATG